MSFRGLLQMRDNVVALKRRGPDQLVPRHPKSQLGCGWQMPIGRQFASSQQIEEFRARNTQNNCTESKPLFERDEVPFNLYGEDLMYMVNVVDGWS